MKFLRRLFAYARILPRASRNRGDLARWLVRRPAILGAVATYETALLASNRMDLRAKSLAVVRTASLIGCPF